MLCWELQEIVSITVTICDTRDVNRPGESSMADKSVSFSFTSAGKALTARTLPSSGAKAVSKPAAAGDLMTLDDVSEHSQSDSDSNGASATAGAGADAASERGTGKLSSALSPTSAGAHATSQCQGTDFSKVVDPGMYAIIKEMAAAIEVAVWDAAMHH